MLPLWHSTNSSDCFNLKIFTSPFAQFYEYLLDLADEKRKAIAKAYEKEDVNHTVIISISFMQKILLFIASLFYFNSLFAKNEIKSWQGIHETPLSLPNPILHGWQIPQEGLQKILLFIASLFYFNS